MQSQTNNGICQTNVLEFKRCMRMEFCSKNNNPSSYDFFPEETEHGIRIVGILSLPHGKSTIWDIATNPDIDIMPLKVESCNNDSGQSNIYEYIESIICLQ